MVPAEKMGSGPNGEIVIGVLSDTHVPTRARAIPAGVLTAFAERNVVHILHAGDLCVLTVIDDLETVAPVTAVRGNMDEWEASGRLPESTVVDLAGVRIGITHGHIGRGRTTPDRAWNRFRDQGVRAVVFGHSHQPFMETREGVLLFNPGSATDRRRAPQCTIGFLTIAEGRIRGEIVPV